MDGVDHDLEVDRVIRGPTGEPLLAQAPEVSVDLVISRMSVAFGLWQEAHRLMSVCGAT